MRELRQLLIGTYGLNVTLQQHFGRDNNQLVLSIENGLAEDFFTKLPCSRSLSLKLHKSIMH